MYQQVTIVGNVGKDPEMKYTGDGKAVTEFTVAVNGYKRDDVTWFRVTCWGKQAEVANEYVKKGKQVLVSGTVKASAWVSKDGEAQATLELAANTVKFLGSREGGGHEQVEEDMPF